VEVQGVARSHRWCRDWISPGWGGGPWPLLRGQLVVSGRTVALVETQFGEVGGGSTAGCSLARRLLDSRMPPASSGSSYRREREGLVATVDAQSEALAAFAREVPDGVPIVLVNLLRFRQQSA
jgi:hypothetical protein